MAMIFFELYHGVLEILLLLYKDQNLQNYYGLGYS
jgi:hypothetical protein